MFLSGIVDGTTKGYRANYLGAMSKVEAVEELLEVHRLITADIHRDEVDSDLESGLAKSQERVEQMILGHVNWLDTFREEYQKDDSQLNADFMHVETGDKFEIVSDRIEDGVYELKDESGDVVEMSYEVVAKYLAPVTDEDVGYNYDGVDTDAFKGEAATVSISFNVDEYERDGIEVVGSVPSDTWDIVVAEKEVDATSNDRLEWLAKKWEKRIDGKGDKFAEELRDEIEEGNE